MTTQHTPGPWHFSFNPGPIVYGTKGEQIADLREEMLDREENRANLFLISAAPELLEAAQFAHSAMLLGMNKVTAMEKLEQAINKATKGE